MQVELHLHHHPYTLKELHNASSETVIMDLKSAMKNVLSNGFQESYGLGVY